MKIRAEDMEKARALLPGLFKFDESERFSQAILALGEDELFIYCDHAPDYVDSEEKVYHVKMRFPKNNIATVVDEKLMKQPELAALDRIAILASNKETYYFYYFNDKNKVVSNFIAGLKHYGYPFQSHKVDMSV